MTPLKVADAAGDGCSTTWRRWGTVASDGLPNLLLVTGVGRGAPRLVGWVDSLPACWGGCLSSSERRVETRLATVWTTNRVPSGIPPHLVKILIPLALRGTLRGS